jgi:protein SCO1/2
MFASALPKLSGVAFIVFMASSSGLYAADDPHAHHNHELPSISDDPHKGHDMSSMDSKDPHAGHDMSSMDPDDPHAHHRAAMKQKSNMAMISLDLPEGLSMINQYGEDVDLRSDVIDDKVVVINFVYTTCETICPVISSIMTLVQKELGDEMDKEVALITITVDPARDTSHRLLSYSKRYDPREGWSWLTGDKRMVDKVNTLLGSYTVSFEDHPAMILIGDSSKSEWYRYYGFPPPADISAKVKELLNNRAG